MTPPAIAAEITVLRRRYLWMATSIFFLDLGITLIFSATTGSWNNFWRSEGGGILLLGITNWLIARRLFEPIRRYLNGDVTFADIQRRLTQLPLLTARYVGLLAMVVIGGMRNMLGPALGAVFFVLFREVFSRPATGASRKSFFSSRAV